ncbi:MAG TPA: HupE/UreJ family protein [Devosiaceae bacterium]|jgi:urease accessory protein
MRHAAAKFWIALAIGVVAATPAFAHFDPIAHGSFPAGFLHPLSGLDHILAMVGVGLWASLLGGKSIWAVPAAFVVTMMAGFGVAMLHVGLPFVEPVIAASVVVLGLLALVALQAPTVVAMVMVGVFAFFHGYAHGGELGEAGALPFMAGFAVATAVLHATGVAIGLGTGRLAGGTGGRLAARIAGGLVALGGVWIAVGA